MFELPDEPTESETDRDGAFSYATEVHAFTVGYAAGLVAVLPVPRLARLTYQILQVEHPSRSGAIAEARAESWYALGGIALGVLSGVAILGAAAWGGLEHLL